MRPWEGMDAKGADFSGKSFSDKDSIDKPTFRLGHRIGGCIK